MRSGVRALGIAESSSDRRSTLAGAVVRADRAVDGLSFGTCTVGGTDATDAVCRLVERMDRPDVRAVLVAGVAPAWFNVIDLSRVADAADRPVLSVSFEASPGLADAIRREFDGRARRTRLATYRAQPDRYSVRLDATRDTPAAKAGGRDGDDGADDHRGEHRLWARGVGIERASAAELLRAFTPEGGRPEPLRVARLAARAGAAFRTGAG